MSGTASNKLRQATLFDLRRGPGRSVKRDSASGEGGKASSASPAAEIKSDEVDRPLKKRKAEDSSGASGSSKAGVETQAFKKPVAPASSARGGKSVTGPPPAPGSLDLKPITHKPFVEKYKVDGLPGAEVYYKPDWVDAETAEQWRKELDTLSEWYRPHLKVYGKTIQQSRSIAAFATLPGLELKYSGHPVTMHSPFPPLLDSIARQLCTDACLGSEVRFNHAMLNRYEDGGIYIGRHSDNLENHVIATVSLGAPRTWIMESRKPRANSKAAAAYERVKKSWILENGSVLVMQGQTQAAYTHEIPKERKSSASYSVPRISITFRQLVY